MKKVSVVVVAAGEGKRFGAPKQFSLLKGKPVLDWSLEKFENHESVDEIILVLKNDEGAEKLLAQYKKIAAVVKGGKKRQDSVVEGFSLIDPRKAGIVLVHDAARPLVDAALISRVIEAALGKGAVIPVLPVEDTVKEVAGQEVLKTLEREKLFKVQTPQGFFYSVLKEALEKAKQENYYGTDEAALVERMGKRVYVVHGNPKNIKITVPEDIKLAEVFLED